MSIKFTGSNPLAANQSAAANFTSAPILMDMLNVMTFDVDWTGTFTGNFYVEATNAPQTQVQIPIQPDSTAIWKTLSSVVVTNGQAAGNSTYWWAEVLTGAKWLRLRYTFGSGTGNFNCTSFGKSYG